MLFGLKFYVVVAFSKQSWDLVNQELSVGSSVWILYAYYNLSNRNLRSGRCGCQEVCLRLLSNQNRCVI